jgi:type I restriction enzyme S subunit
MGKGLPKNWVSEVPLMDVANVYTGKKDANFASEDGKYHFFTCAYKPLKADSYSYEGKVLILPGNGVNVGEVFFYDGKFEAYQRTYIINDIDIVPKYLFYHLKRFWRERGSSEQFGSATNYIKIGNFNNYKFELPPPRRATTHSSQVRCFVWAFSAGENTFSQHTPTA